VTDANARTSSRRDQLGQGDREFGVISTQCGLEMGEHLTF
jgi:hypothetical protein